MSALALVVFGWDGAFRFLWILENLPQTDETLLWLMRKLDGVNELTESIAKRICSLIANADAQLLGRHGCKWLDEDSRWLVDEKIRLLSIPTDACWQELESLCEQHKSDRDNQRFDFGRPTRLVEAISRDGDRYADRILSVLSQKIENFDNNPLPWLEIFVAMLAGMIRLEASAPLLVAKLKDDDGDFINEQCAYALTKIGGDAAIEAIAKDFHAVPWHNRLYASSALEDMRGENVVAKALELLKGEEDWDIQTNLIGAALANFDTQGLRAAMDFGIDDLSELRRGVIATAVLTGENFPDLQRLQEVEKEHQAEVRRRLEWMESGFQTAPHPIADQPVVRPIKAGKKVGRNDPCPCGSGKKYKKCCLVKA